MAVCKAGSVCFRSSTLFTASSISWKKRPVTLPVGRASEFTYPSANGSPPPHDALQSRGDLGDAQAEQRVERRLAAIFAADVAGYSRLMSQDEAGTLRALAAAREVMDGLISAHGGRIANTAGDSVLAEFPSAVDAVAVRGGSSGEARLRRDAGVPEDGRLQFRIGIHVGDVAVRGGDLLGDGVNVAARLEGLAEPGGVGDLRRGSRVCPKGSPARLHRPGQTACQKH